MVETNQLIALDDIQIYLLASIGRPSEMNYVFDELKENDQFDLLFAGDLSKVSFAKYCTFPHCVTVIYLFSLFIYSWISTKQ